MENRKPAEPKAREEKLKRGRAIVIPPGVGATIVLREGLTSVRLVVISTERVKHVSLEPYDE
jgi:hypothetical protein